MRYLWLCLSAVFFISFLIVSSKFVTVRKKWGTKGHRSAIPAVFTGGPSSSSVEAQWVVLFLSCMPLGRKFLAVFTDVDCLALLRRISKEAGQGSSISLLFLVSWLLTKKSLSWNGCSRNTVVWGSMMVNLAGFYRHGAQTMKAARAYQITFCQSAVKQELSRIGHNCHACEA